MPRTQCIHAMSTDQDVIDLRKLADDFCRAFKWGPESDKQPRSLSGLLRRVADRLEKNVS